MRTRLLTYADAVELLGGADDPVVRVVGRLAGVAAAGVSVATAGTVDVLGLRDELVRWGNGVVRGLRDRVRGLHRLDRTQRLAAAHAVLVLTSFYESLDLDPRLAELTSAEQVALATGDWPGDGYRDLVQALLASPPPMPAAHRPFEETLEELSSYYLALIEAVCYFLHGLSASAGRQAELDDLLRRRPKIVHGAVRRYREGYLALAAQIPEFAAWTAQLDAEATRTLLRGVAADLHTGLSEVRSSLRGVADLLAAMDSGAAMDRVRADLAHRYRSQLDRPILTGSQAPPHVVMPTLEAGYVNPGGRVAVAGRSDLPATESWWRDKPLFADLQRTIVGHLTSPAALDAPLVVLGQPGSGKSVLTRLLSARLSAPDFLAVRVELRNVPADSSIQGQLEHALYQALGERISWPELARHAGDALPVVLLDGFDELLQATGMNRADYLEQVQEFQRREAELLRPVAVLVTSRTVVADRARFPDGTVVVRLEAFDGTQVEAWLDVWNRLNGPGLAARGLATLPARVVLDHHHLAGQPLLLLLLALYDAGDNALQRQGPGIGRAELYTQLFEDFAGREVDKHGSWRSTEQRQDAIAGEWRRLCAVALATLNRRGDVITEAELEADLPRLLAPEDFVEGPADAAHRALTVGQLLVGRFFFIHESSSTRDTGRPERSYEFLHATFGDFLAARLIVDALVDLATERVHQRRRRQAGYDAGFFYAATSFVTVTRRAPLRDFCRELLHGLSADDRRRCRELAVELFAEAGYPHPTWSHQEYQPHLRVTAARHATFSANLLWFTVALSDGPVDVAELVGDAGVFGWREQALLWESQLRPEDREALWQNLRVAWRFDGPVPQLRVRPEDGEPVSMYQSLPWPPEADAVRPDGPLRSLAPDVVVPADANIGRALRRSAFLQLAHDVREYLHALAAYLREFGDLRWFDAGDGDAVSDATVLLRLLLEPFDGRSDEERVELYRTAISPGPPDRYRALMMRQLLFDAPHLGEAGAQFVTAVFASVEPAEGLQALVDALEGVCAVGRLTGEPYDHWQLERLLTVLRERLRGERDAARQLWN